jgi:alkylhydroperoxidase family enzyme
MPRIEPLSPPYDDVAGPLLAAMMPAGADPILLFRTFARNPTMTAAMRGWGSYELGRELSLSMRQRELVIDRTCARCGCEYEWGVHVAFFAERVGLNAAQVRSIVHGDPGDECWTDTGEVALLRAVDELHETSDLSDACWAELQGQLSTEQVLDVLLLAGWYHAISYAANGARVPLEPGAPRFAEVS